MATRIRKILVEFVRSTSHIRPAFRFEVPILKKQNPTETIAIHEIPHPTPSDVQEFEGPREAYLAAQAVYGQFLNQAYVDFADFEQAFNATAKRDAVGQTVAPANTFASPDAARLEAVTTMSKITGVGSELAAGLFESGFRSIEDVARSTLNELEAVPGIGPANSTVIHESAKRIVLASFGEKPDEGPKLDDSASVPVSTNPFE